ncbi:MAG: clan AA aspartic protease [Chloroflexota bacterium]|nr:clan AA aspartic protease [Chloroflexota bacterium]MDE2968858.1 clan AA aspartic protease [Chloroflexota bacterium]
MILGTVTGAYEAVISLTVQGPAGQTREVESVIDTGFTGFLSLPSALVTELGLPFLTTESAFLADGSLVSFSVHDATVFWDGHPRRVYVHISDATPLVGMRMLDGHDLNIRVRDGGRVAIEAAQ